MMRMGPEALLVKSRIDPRVALAEFARMEEGRMEAHAVEARIRRELEFLPVQPSLSRRFLRWGQKWLRHRESQVVASLPVQPERVGSAKESAAEMRALSAATLATMPALRGGRHPEGPALPISGAPIFARP